MNAYPPSAHGQAKTSRGWMGRIPVMIGLFFFAAAAAAHAGIVVLPSPISQEIAPPAFYHCGPTELGYQSTCDASHTTTGTSLTGTSTVSYSLGTNPTITLASDWEPYIDLPLGILEPGGGL